MKKLGKKVLVLLVVCALLVTTIVACGDKKAAEGDAATTAEATTQAATQAETTANADDPYGKYPELIEFTTVLGVNQDPKWPAGQSEDNNIWLDFIKEKLNVQQKPLWKAPTDGEQYFNKLKLTVASGDLPDMFVIDNMNQGDAFLKQLVEADVIEDLTDVYNKYASPAVKEAYAAGNDTALKLVTFNGKLMAIPGQGDATQTNAVWVRQDWLDKLQLPAPESIENLRKVAKAFATQDPDGNGKNDTVGLTLAGSPIISAVQGDMHRADLIFNIFNAYPSIWVKDDSGNVAWGGIQPQVKEGLTVLSEMYKNGEIDPEFAIKDNGKTSEDLGAGKSGLVFQPWWAPFWPLQNTVQNNPNAVWKAYGIAADDGSIHASYNKLAGSYFVVRKGYEHPELLMKLINLTTDMKNSKFEDLAKERLTGSYMGATPAAQWGFFPGMGGAVTVPNVVEVTMSKIQSIMDGKEKTDILDFEQKTIYDKIMAYKDQVGKPVDKDQVANWQQYTAWVYGLAPALKNPAKVTYNEYPLTTPTMEKKWENLKTLQTETYLKIIMGKEKPETFDAFVTKWNEQGGADITKEVQEALKK